MACSSFRYFKQRFYNACYALRLFILFGILFIVFTVIKHKTIGAGFSMTRRSQEHVFPRGLNLLREDNLDDFMSASKSTSDTATGRVIQEGDVWHERRVKTKGILQDPSRGEDGFQDYTITVTEHALDAVTNQERATFDVTTVSSQGDKNLANEPDQGRFSLPINDTAFLQGVDPRPDVSLSEQFSKFESSNVSFGKEHRPRGGLISQATSSITIPAKTETRPQTRDTTSIKTIKNPTRSLEEQRNRTLNYLEVPSKNYDELFKMFQTEAALELDRRLFEIPTDETALRRFPQCVIIGFAKCGTRALIGYMEMHPYVRIAANEPHFYDMDEEFKKGYDQYLSRMPTSYSNQVTIEKTPGYVTSYRALQEIRKNFPETKLIAIMKDPVERLVSQYMQSNRFNMQSPPPLNMFYRHHDASFSPNVAPVDIGVYHKHLRPWIETFPRKQLLFLDGHQLIRDPLPIVKKVETFLRLPPMFKSSNFVFNATKGFFCRRYFGEREIKCLSDNKGFEHPVLPPEDEQMLRAFYGPHNLRLYRMIGETFSW